MEKIITQLRILREMEIKPNYSELARIYSKDRRTIKKYDLGYEGRPNTRNKASKLDTYYDEISEKLSYKGARIKSVYEFLKDKYGDYIGGYNNFTIYVKKKEFLVNKSKTPSVRFETPMGKQAQVDWKEDIKLVSKHGELFEFNVFAYKLGNSRKVYFEYSITKTREDVYRCIINACKSLGGVPEEILFDNMSSVVDVSTGKTNNKFLEFAKDIGFKVRRCRVRKPQTKGKVETANKFLDWLIPYNYEFENELDLIKIIEIISKKVNATANKTTGVPPNLLFQKEKEYLQLLPQKSLMESYISADKKYKVYPDSLINYNGQKYSVPYKYINQFVTVKQIDDLLQIYCNTELVSTHKISNRIFNYIPEQYKDMLVTTAIRKEKLDDIVENNLKNFDLILKNGGF